MTTVLPLALVRKFRSVGDISIRRGLMSRTLSKAEPSTIARFLIHMLDDMGSEGVRALYLDAILALLPEGSLPRDARDDLCRRLMEGRYPAVCGFLCDHSRPGTSRTAAREFPYELIDEALGVRKARARSRDLDTLRMLAADPDPEVVRILFTNPKTTEEIALKVASMRPQTAATFEVMLSDVRFGVREIVQVAIANNPFCPVGVAAAIVPLLSFPRLEQIRTSSTLDARVRDAAWEMRSRVSRGLRNDRVD